MVSSVLLGPSIRAGGVEITEPRDPSWLNLRRGWLAHSLHPIPHLALFVDLLISDMTDTATTQARRPYGTPTPEHLLRYVVVGTKAAGVYTHSRYVDITLSGSFGLMSLENSLPSLPRGSGNPWPIVIVCTNIDDVNLYLPLVGYFKMLSETMQDPDNIAHALIHLSKADLPGCEDLQMALNHAGSFYPLLNGLFMDAIYTNW